MAQVMSMNPEAMTPYGRALWAYLHGQSAAELMISRDDGVTVPLPAAVFFREPSQFTPIETRALELCRGQVLDIGAGAGPHSLELQSRGLAPIAIDVDPQAVAVMAERGVRDARQSDVFQFQGGPFDTLLMIGHGIGVVEDLAGLQRFLIHARGLMRREGQLLLDSLDVRRSDDPQNLAYQEANRLAGRYIGEIRMQIEFEGKRGPFCGWLQVDSETLSEKAAREGWDSEILLELESGDYLARLTPNHIREGNAR
jgi:hypothetical protein